MTLGTLETGAPNGLSFFVGLNSAMVCFLSRFVFTSLSIDFKLKLTFIKASMALITSVSVVSGPAALSTI